jgi:conjugal transfer pilin signal peptidase TrbI
MSAHEALKTAQTQPQGITVRERNRRFGRLIVSHLKRQWICYVLLAACYWLVTANYRLLPNASNSIGVSWFVVRIHEPVERGHFVAFRAPRNGIYPDSLWWVKRVVGVGGDLITRRDDTYLVNGREVGVARRHGQTGRVMELLAVPAGGRVLESHELFVLGDHPFSFDSRYAAIGVIDRSKTIGRAHAIY